MSNSADAERTVCFDRSNRKEAKCYENIAEVEQFFCPTTGDNWTRSRRLAFIAQTCGVTFM